MIKTKILIIEDDKFLVSILEEAIDQEKFKVILALDSESGFQKAVSEKPAVIVLDVLLPGESGFECLEQLKKNPKTKNIPVIILSNLGQDEEVRRGMELGAIDYLVKADFKVEEIVNKIVKAVNKR